jgi:hypothetical protein
VNLPLPPNGEPNPMIWAISTLQEACDAVMGEYIKALAERGHLPSETWPTIRKPILESIHRTIADNWQKKPPAVPSQGAA